MTERRKGRLRHPLPPRADPGLGRPSAAPCSASAAVCLTLREGSIIVVTLIAIIYFAINVDNFVTIDNFKNLLPYFAPFAILGAGEVFVMINGEIDLSIGAVYLLGPFIFYKFNEAGLPLIPALVAGPDRLHADRLHQRVLRRRRRDRLVRRHPRHPCSRLEGSPS